MAHKVYNCWDYGIESRMYGHLPKHWDAGDRKVKIWMPFSQVDYPVERLIGTYTFVSMRREGDERARMGEDNPGFLKLFIRPNQTEAHRNVCGIFRASNDWRRGTFSGLRANPKAEGSDPPRPNAYLFDLVTAQNIVKRGHALDVLDVQDDKGNNFISMMLEYDVDGSECIWFMGKKTEEGEPDAQSSLTQEEKERLGIDIPFEIVEERGRG
ncbi:hypothetical protein DL96DRAFT_1549456 [Flagelloscypha sp. PMI_526]|nr:hypothetical protein DL96DRAFT_1549456 [Flagelloscypha sp. PMI_526]